MRQQLQEKLKAAAEPDAVAAIAKEAGFSIFVEDLKNAQSEITDEELEGAAGGAVAVFSFRRCGEKELCIRYSDVWF